MFSTLTSTMTTSPRSSDPPSPPTRKEHLCSYKISEKVTAIKVARDIGVRRAEIECKVPRRTLRDWVDKDTQHEEFTGNKKNTALGGQGRKEMVPFAQELVTFMKDRRRNDKVDTNSKVYIVFIGTF